MCGMCVRAHPCTHTVHTHTHICMWWSEDNLPKPVLSLQQVGPRDQTQVTRLGGKRLHLLSLLPAPLSLLKH